MKEGRGGREGILEEGLFVLSARKEGGIAESESRSVAEERKKRKEGALLFLDLLKKKENAGSRYVVGRGNKRNGFEFKPIAKEERRCSGRCRRPFASPGKRKKTATPEKLRDRLPEEEGEEEGASALLRMPKGKATTPSEKGQAPGVSMAPMEKKRGKGSSPLSEGESRYFERREVFWVGVHTLGKGRGGRRASPGGGKGADKIEPCSLAKGNEKDSLQLGLLSLRQKSTGALIFAGQKNLHRKERGRTPISMREGGFPSLTKKEGCAPTPHRARPIGKKKGGEGGRLISSQNRRAASSSFSIGRGLATAPPKRQSGQRHHKKKEGKKGLLFNFGGRGKKEAAFP